MSFDKTLTSDKVDLGNAPNFWHMEPLVSLFLRMRYLSIKQFVSQWQVGHAFFYASAMMHKQFKIPQVLKKSEIDRYIKHQVHDWLSWPSGDICYQYDYCWHASECRYDSVVVWASAKQALRSCHHAAWSKKIKLCAIYNSVQWCIAKASKAIAHSNNRADAIFYIVIVHKAGLICLGFCKRRIVSIKMLTGVDKDALLGAYDTFKRRLPVSANVTHHIVSNYEKDRFQLQSFFGGGHWQWLDAGLMMQGSYWTGFFAKDVTCAK